MPAAGPSTAERVRTVCAGAAEAQLVGEGAAPRRCPVHHLLPDGTLAVTVRSGAVGADRTPVMLELLDPVPLGPDGAVRSLVWIRGEVRPVPASEVTALLDVIAAARPQPALLDVGHRDALMVIRIDSIVFADASGAEAVEVSAVLAASPDPFCHTESAWVHYLQCRHPDMIDRLRLRLPRPVRRSRLRLVGLDRFGVRLRTEGPEGDWDMRVPFFAPVCDEAALGRALRLLMGCPFSDCLRRR